MLTTQKDITFNSDGLTLDAHTSAVRHTVQHVVVQGLMNLARSAPSQLVRDVVDPDKADMSSA